MNSVSSIFVAVSLIFGGGYALDKIYVYTKRTAIEHIQGGLPHLTDFTSRMTCSKISEDGKLVPGSCLHVVSKGKKPIDKRK